MLFRQVLHEDLGCASYVIADGGTAAVVDPKWPIEDYLALASLHGFEIRHVLETHNHADHLSGHGRLAAATGATIHVSDDADAEYDHEPLADGDAVEIGSARLVAVSTPGHRPEHTAFLLLDDEEPWAVLTGDSLFVGDVGRPDLAVEPEEGARGLFRSLRRLLDLPDFVEVWPGHIGGSLCGGGAMSKKPSSTIGRERRRSPLLALEDEDEFVRTLMSELQPQPPNFERIVELNRGPLVTSPPPGEALEPHRVAELLDAGAVLVDGREPREWDALHVPGSLSVTMAETGVGTRAAWVVEPDSPVVVAGAGQDDARTLVRLLEAVGFRNIAGFLAGGVAAWREAGLPLASAAAIDAPTLAARLKAGEVELLDVRDEDEWKAGHVEGSTHVPYHDLRDGIPERLARRDGKPLAVACAAGNRSAVAVSLLLRAGVDDVEHVAGGGIADLADEGLSLVAGD